MSHTQNCGNRPTIFVEIQKYAGWILGTTHPQAIKDHDSRPQISPTTTDRPMTAAAGQPLLPNNLSCKKPIDGITRIVGGQTAKNGEWDWIVQFPQVGCGGAVISKNWVITAAHCCKAVVEIGLDET